jgi:surface polysaccharide O-acyltransferase-like enzyme
MIQKEQIRIPYVDNLRAMIIIIVVMVHTAVTYSGMGMWYYKENTFLDIGSKIFFGSFLSLAQSFDMSFLFMLAGYFIPFSFEVKGPVKFIKARLYRLGVPLLIYMAIIHPLAVKLAYPKVNLVNYYIQGLETLSIFSWSGPLWFVLTLLCFTLIFALVRMVSKNPNSFTPPKINIISISLLTLIIAIPAFLIRIVMPLGTAIMNLQIPYFSGYVVMFIIGIIAKRLELFDHIDYDTGKKWLNRAFSLGYASFGLLMIFGGPMRGEERVLSGLTWQSLAYALWESFSCVAITIGLIGIFQNRFNRQNRLQKLLSENYFGVYVFHAPILIAISVSLSGLIVHPLIKFILVAPSAIIASYLFTFFVRKIHFLKSIFS